MKYILVLLLTFVICLSFNAQNDKIDPFTKSSCFVQISKKGKQIATATGFFVILNKKGYFITNNHVVGGEFLINEYKRNHNNQMPPIDDYPDTLYVRAYGKDINEFKTIKIPLYKNDVKNWIEFWEDENTKKNLLDIVAIPITQINKIDSLLQYTVAFNKQNLHTNLELIPTTELFIVGFPLGFGQNNIYPIWKKGTIATDPSIHFQGEGFPNFLVDATTRGGMSGSPVFYRSNQYSTKQGVNNIGQQVIILVGIYNSQSTLMELGGIYELPEIFNKLEKY